MSRLSNLLYNDLESLADLMSGDNPPRDLVELGAAVANLTNQALRLQRRLDKLEEARDAEK